MGEQNAWVGKCPNWTSPNYWGYNHQQILESDVQNPPNRTFTNPWNGTDGCTELTNEIECERLIFCGSKTGEWLERCQCFAQTMLSRRKKTILGGLLRSLVLGHLHFPAISCLKNILPVSSCFLLSAAWSFSFFSFSKWGLDRWQMVFE